MISVKNFEGVSLFMSNERLYAGEDLPVGTLVGVKDGKLVKADSATAIPAVTIITTGSARKWGEGYQFNRESVLRKGDSAELYKIATLSGVPEEMIGKSDWARGKAVYLGTEGKVTLTKPTTQDHIVQPIGVLGDPTRKEVLLFLLQGYEVVPAGIGG
ncbi:MAG: hypothetical protein ACRC1T_09150 [Clostridium chrysemydis]|uniref:hypothetical protein n=1 Tax=Clostridium chrysemydis TaxID=2665504 RepID=UPI003F38CE96